MYKLVKREVKNAVIHTCIYVCILKRTGMLDTKILVMIIIDGFRGGFFYLSYTFVYRLNSYSVTFVSFNFLDRKKCISAKNLLYLRLYIKK